MRGQPANAKTSGREAYDGAARYVACRRAWADDVRGRALDCGHFLPEEAPAETLSELRRFFEAQ